MSDGCDTIATTIDGTFLNVNDNDNNNNHIEICTCTEVSLTGRDNG